jgi:hypothetical protein
MSLWFVLTGVAVWLGLCTLAVALCTAAARGDRDDARRWFEARRDATEQGARRPTRLRVLRSRSDERGEQPRRGARARRTPQSRS